MKTTRKRLTGNTNCTRTSGAFRNISTIHAKYVNQGKAKSSKLMTTMCQIFKKDTDIDLDNIWAKKVTQSPENEEAADSKSAQSYAEGGQAAEEKEQEAPRPKSNLIFVLSVIDGFLKKFKASSHTVDNQNARIVEKYPKYLSKYSLIGLQFDDFLFRETFLFQILIFTKTLAQPVTQEQKNAFKFSKDEQAKIQEIETQVLQLLKGDSDQKMIG